MFRRKKNLLGSKDDKQILAKIIESSYVKALESARIGILLLESAHRYEIA